jgi:hypothetical protein
MKFVWIPEAPSYPGLYANRNGTDLDACKIKGLVHQPSTMDPYCALQFPSQAECQVWCDANPVPAFVPREHGFA